MRMTVVIIMAMLIVISVVVMVIVAMLIMIVVIRVVVMVIVAMVIVAMVVVAMLIMIVMIVMIIVAMIIMIVVIIMVVMVVMVVVAMIIMVVVIVMVIAMSVNNSIEVFSFPVNNRGAEGCFNGKCAVVGKTPLEDVTELSIDGVVLRLAIEVGLKTTMSLDCDHGSGPELTFWQLFTAAMTAMGIHAANCGVTGKQQSKS